MAQLCIGQSFWMIMTPLKITKIAAGDTPQRTPVIGYGLLPHLPSSSLRGYQLWSNACLNLRHPKLG